MMNETEFIKAGGTAEEFAKLDVNGDGQIDTDELAGQDLGALALAPVAETEENGETESLLGTAATEGTPRHYDRDVEDLPLCLKLAHVIFHLPSFSQVLKSTILLPIFLSMPPLSPSLTSWMLPHAVVVLTLEMHFFTLEIHS